MLCRWGLEWKFRPMTDERDWNERQSCFTSTKTFLAFNGVEGRKGCGFLGWIFLCDGMTHRPFIRAMRVFLTIDGTCTCGW